MVLCVRLLLCVRSAPPTRKITSAPYTWYMEENNSDFIPPAGTGNMGEILCRGSVAALEIDKQVSLV